MLKSDLAEAQKETAHAFEAVFGTAGNRNPAQQRVWTHLEAFCHVRQPVFILTLKGDLCALKAAFADGRRSYWREVMDQLDFAQRSETAVKPKTIRR